jgi:hypothetical protein
MRHWLRDFWPWWVALFWLIGYEIYALATREADHVTLSRLVWRAYQDNPWLQWPVALICLVLLVHFFVRREAAYPLALLAMGIVLILTFVLRRLYL